MMLSGDVITSDGKIDPVLWARNSPHVRETKTILDSGFHAMDSGFQSLDSRSFSVELGSGFQGPGFRIPHEKISRIPESGFPYMGPHKYTFSECALL